MKATRSSVLSVAFAICLFIAATVEGITAQAPKDAGAAAPSGTQTFNLVESTMGRTLWMLAILGLLIIVVIAFRRSQKKLKK